VTSHRLPEASLDHATNEIASIAFERRVPDLLACKVAKRIEALGASRSIYLVSEDVGRRASITRRLPRVREKIIATRIARVRAWPGAVALDPRCMS
jgi:hypothetical protein